MANQVRTILRRALREETKELNILTFGAHERYETGMTKTGHQFYAIRGEGIKEWNEQYAKRPSNYHLLPPTVNNTIQTPGHVDFDLIISHNKWAHWPIANSVSKQLGIPLISVEHTLPRPEWDAMAKQLYVERIGDTNVFVSEYQYHAWGFTEELPNTEINHTGIDLNTFQDLEQDRKPFVLSICNDWINRDWCCGYYLWENVTGFRQEQGIMAQPHFPIKIMGDTPGLSVPAENILELVYAYNEATVFLNTTTVSSLPTVILEAMACGCPVVSTATCLIPEIVIDNGVNGFVSNDPEELRQYCMALLQDPDLRKRIGEAGRKTVEEKFSEQRFTQKWDDIIMRSIE